MNDSKKTKKKQIIINSQQLGGGQQTAILAPTLLAYHGQHMHKRKRFFDICWCGFFFVLLANIFFVLIIIYTKLIECSKCLVIIGNFFLHSTESNGTL